jgi:hypothetical protein
MNTRSLAHLPGRGGITVNAQGDEAPLGFWPEKFNGASGYVGTMRQHFGEVVRIAQRYHEQNRAIINGKATRQPVTLPEPDVRAKLARADQRKLGQLHQAVRKIADEAFTKKVALQPFDYGADVIDALRRQELRSSLKAMPNEQARLEAVKKLVYRRAALEQPAELSGLRPTSHERIHEAEIAQKFPDVVAAAADTAEAQEVLALAIKTTNKAIANELLASGTTVNEPPEPVASKAWA